MRIEVLTLFPEMFEPLKLGIVGSAIKKGIFSLNLTNFRDFARDKFKHVDDSPFGGGAGMIVQAQPIADALDAVDPEHKCKRIYLSPRGELFKQKVARELATESDLLFLCGSYEGVDQRVIDKCFDMELSIGDYVLTSGELAAQVVINCVVRHLDGVLGSAESLEEESFCGNLLEYPQYTRPQLWEGMEVPEVLVSGDHAKVAKWRRTEQERITRLRRPDLLD